MRSKFKWIFTLLVAFTMQFSFAQEKTIKGNVTDAMGPMPGVNVVVQGTQRGTQTDFDGSYSIKANVGETLVFSYLGMRDVSRVVDASGSINVVMQDDAKQLGEVIVTGSLGIKRNRDAVVSAQKQVNNKELTQAANPNAIQALTGKVSGLQINTVSNGVNAETRIVLRGTRSITGNNQALVVIDNAISSSNVLSQLPPDIIESVNVIKGAQGAALYGEQGVNGVILVTTKKGSKREKMTVSLTSAVDFESVMFVPERQMQYGQGWSTDPGFHGPGIVDTFVPFENGSWGPSFSNPGMGPIVPVGLPQADGNFLYTEWKPIKDNIKDFFQTGTVMQTGVSVNMGSEDAYALLSLNHQATDFVVDGDNLRRNSVLFKGGKKFGKFSVDANFNYINQSTSQTSPDLFDDLIQTAVNIPVTRFRNSGNEGHWTVYASNPYWMAKANRFDNKSNITNAIVNLNYEFNKHINVTYNANVRLTSTDAQQHQDAFDNTSSQYTYDFGAYGAYDYYGDTVYTYADLGGQPVISSYFANQSSSRNFYGDLLFNFNYDLTSKLNLKFNIGNNLQDNTARITSQGGSNLDVPGFYHITNVLNPSRPATLNNRLDNTRRASFFVNADLAYEDYLFLNATYRRDQSSVIKSAAYYPSVGVSFIPTKFFGALKDKNGISYMKLNASYTSVGNTTAVNAYATTDLAAISAGFPFGTLASYQYNINQTNPDIKPEYVNTFEVGGQFGFFKDRVTLEGSYYIANTKDLITNSTNSTTSGQRSYLDNIGDLENKGFEIDLGLTPIKTESFKWDIKGSYSTYKTVVKSLQDGLTSINLQSNGVVGVFAEVGEEFPLIKGTTFVKDANGNYIVDTDFGNLPKRSSELTKLGKANPDYIIGLTNSFEYKGIRLTAVADYRTGGSTYSFAKNLLLFTGGDLDTAGFNRDLGYTLDGPAVDQNGNPYTGPVSTPDYAGVTTYFTETHRAVAETNMIDTSALKIRELSLSYALPTKLVEKMGLEAFRLGVNARNPFVFLADGKLLKPKNGLHANNGYSDPEASNTTGNAQGITDIGQYPSTRTLGFSVNVTF